MLKSVLKRPKGRNEKPSYTNQMESKTYIWIGLTAGGLIGGGIGSLLDRGNMLGLWSLLLSTIGGIAGIWAGYKLANG